MATTTKRTQQTIGEYYGQMTETGVKALKAIRIAYVSTVLLGAYWVAVQAGADPESTLPWIVAAILLVAGFEIAELEALKKFTSVSISVGKEDGD